MTKPDIYQEVTDRIVTALENGTVPWIRPWTSNPLAGGMEANAATGRKYNGINVLLLWAERHAAGYELPSWLTFRQAKQLGGHVREGERGTRIVFWNFRNMKAANDNGDSDSELRGQGRTLCSTSASARGCLIASRSRLPNPRPNTNGSRHARSL